MSSNTILTLQYRQGKWKLGVKTFLEERSITTIISSYFKNSLEFIFDFYIYLISILNIEIYINVYLLLKYWLEKVSHLFVYIPQLPLLVFEGTHQ